MDSVQKMRKYDAEGNVEPWVLGGDDYEPDNPVDLDINFTAPAWARFQDTIEKLVYPETTMSRNDTIQFYRQYLTDWQMSVQMMYAHNNLLASLCDPTKRGSGSGRGRSNGDTGSSGSDSNSDSDSIDHWDR